MSRGSVATLKCVMIGDGGVGKTSLRHQLLHGRFTTSYQATIGADFAVQRIPLADGTSVQLQIWDTAGQERFQSLGTAFYRGADGLVLVYDVTDPDSLAHLEMWLRGFFAKADVVRPSTFPIIMIGNKIDCFQERRVTKQQARAVATRLGEVLAAIEAAGGDPQAVVPPRQTASRPSQRLTQSRAARSLSPALLSPHPLSPRQAYGSPNKIDHCRGSMPLLASAASMTATSPCGDAGTQDASLYPTPAPSVPASITMLPSDEADDANERAAVSESCRVPSVTGSDVSISRSGAAASSLGNGSISQLDLERPERPECTTDMTIATSASTFRSMLPATSRFSSASSRPGALTPGSDASLPEASHGVMGSPSRLLTPIRTAARSSLPYPLSIGINNIPSFSRHHRDSYVSLASSLTHYTDAQSSFHTGLLRPDTPTLPFSLPPASPPLASEARLPESRAPMTLGSANTLSAPTPPITTDTTGVPHSIEGDVMISRLAPDQCCQHPDEEDTIDKEGDEGLCPSLNAGQCVLLPRTTQDAEAAASSGTSITSGSLAATTCDTASSSESSEWDSGEQSPLGSRSDAASTSLSASDSRSRSSSASGSAPGPASGAWAPDACASDSPDELMAPLLGRPVPPGRLPVVSETRPMPPASHPGDTTTTLPPYSSNTIPLFEASAKQGTRVAPAFLFLATSAMVQAAIFTHDPTAMVHPTYDVFEGMTMTGDGAHRRRRAPTLWRSGRTDADVASAAGRTDLVNSRHRHRLLDAGDASDQDHEDDDDRAVAANGHGGLLCVLGCLGGGHGVPPPRTDTRHRSSSRACCS